MPKPLGSLGKARRWLKVFIYASASILSCALPIQASTSATIVEFADNPEGFQFQAGDFAFVYPTSDTDIYALSNNKHKAVTACTYEHDGDGDCNRLDDDTNRTAHVSLTGPFADVLPASGLYVARLLSSSSEAIIHETLGQRALNAARSGIECAVVDEFGAACIGPLFRMFSGIVGLENCSYRVTPVSKSIEDGAKNVTYWTPSCTGQCTAGKMNVTRLVYVDAMLEVE